MFYDGNLHVGGYRRFARLGSFRVPEEQVQLLHQPLIAFTFFF